MVATSVAKKGGRDIIKLPRHQLRRLEVATSSAKERGSRRHSVVATSTAKKRRSRHHSVVATSVAKKGGHDIIKLSRHQLRRLEVATSFSSRDIISKGKKARHHSMIATSSTKREARNVLQAVATSVARKGGRNIIYLSRNLIQGMLKTSRDQIKASAT